MTDHVQAAVSPGRFTGQRAIITGGAGGIGFGCARRLAAEGADVVILDVDEAKGEAAAARIVAAGYSACFRQTDASEPAALEAALEVADDGTLGLLVCAAGIGAPAVDFLALDISDFDRVQNVNLRGPLLLGQMMARRMIAAGRTGAFIFIGSVASKLASADRTPYCVSKAGLAMLVKTMALSLIQHGIRVNGVAPGPVNTPFFEQFIKTPGAEEATRLRTPIGRAAEIEEIAGTVAFLASNDAGYFVGQSLYPDGGRLALNHVVQSTRPAETKLF